MTLVSPALAPDPLTRYEITDTGCFEWTGSRDVEGYGRYFVGSRRTGDRGSVKAHRGIYEAIVGPIPDGLVIDHLCRNRACVNPDHLEPVTPYENVHRSPVAPAAVNSQKTHCPQGHPYDGRVVSSTRGVLRRCKACQREATRRYRAQIRGGESNR